ncbi:hypothetical protein [Enemella evansiae]|uniref:hypothetical protein n=1 Tax=Enemella evansiae TaxID=2016499 RepID=UPI001180601A|nr:hypothetical protein [Enemella evansiae]
MSDTSPPSPLERAGCMWLFIIWMLASPVVLIVGAIVEPGSWLWVPGLGTAVFGGFGLLVWLLGRDRSAKPGGRRTRRQDPITLPTELPKGMTADPYAAGVTELWAGTVPPANFSGGHFENRLDGLVGAKRASNGEPTSFTAFEHVTDEGDRSWHLLVPLSAPLPPLQVAREQGKQDRGGDIDTGDEQFDRLYAVTGWDTGTEAEQYVREFLTPAVIAQMKEVAFDWRIRGRFLVASPPVGSARAAISFAQNQGTQLALIADQLPAELFTRYADWYTDPGGLPPGLVNPGDLR